MIEYFNKHSNIIYILSIIFIILLGIVLRFTGMDLRPLFTDEAVHYGFFYDLWKSQPYVYHEIISTRIFDTYNFALNIYFNIHNQLGQGQNIFSLDRLNYYNYIDTPLIIKLINDSVQPYYYFMHLLNNGAYKYDPVYHGPLMYYIGDLTFNIAGYHSIYLLRLPMVIASSLAMFYIFLFKDYLGKTGLLITLALVATSPGLVYFSNLANYENYISTFTVLGVGLLLLGIKNKSPWILFLSGFVLLGLMTFKETALVSWFCIVMSFLATFFILYIKNRPSKIIEKLENAIIQLLTGAYNKNIIPYLFPAFLCFLLSGAFFSILYSSFGGNSTGIHDGLTSWMYWKNTGESSGHNKPFGYYTNIILNYDFSLVYLFIIGSILTLFSNRNFFKIFIIFWALIMWFVYSSINYKTPWLLINFLLPFTIAAGVGVNLLFEYIKSTQYRVIITFLFVCLFTISFSNTIITKFFDYDLEENLMTYVHTYREFEDEIKALYTFIDGNKNGRKTEVSIAAPDYWPMPAYIFDYKYFGYFGGVKGKGVNLNAPIIINDSKDNPELRELLLESDINDFIMFRSYKVRPGVTHTIFIKKSLFDNLIQKDNIINLTNIDRSYLLKTQKSFKSI